MVIQSADASLVVDTKHTTELWCVYEHQVVLKEGEPPSVIMIGACRLREVYLLIDGKTNTEWAKIYANGGSVLVRIVGVTLDKMEAMRHAQTLVRSATPTPICNLQGYNIRGSARAVRCINNDTRYNTQREAAEALGVSASALSRHLRGELTHANGLRFVYDQEGVL